jgi:hypothetical protein
MGRLPRHVRTGGHDQRRLDGQCCSRRMVSNIVDAVTGPDGKATVKAVAPRWADYFIDKPQRISAYFSANGGGNPRADALMCFKRP